MFEKFTNKIKQIFKPQKKDNRVPAGTGISAYNTGNYYYPEYGSGSKFVGGMSRPASVNIHNHYAIRQNVRDAMYDSSVARAVVERKTDTIVDSGLTLKPTPVYDMLGITAEQAEEWAEDVAQKFHLWAKSKKSHRSRVNTFYQNQRLYMKFQQRENDVFVPFFYSRDKDVYNPLQIDFIDPNQIRGFAFTSSFAQFPYDDGIIRDNNGREIGYKIWNMTEEGEYVEKTIPAKGEKSGRVFMIHGFNPEYAGQGRGYAKLAHALQEFENLTDFKVSTIQKAINQASFIGAVENDQQDASQPLEGIPAGPIAQYGSNPNPDTAAANVTDESLAPIVNWNAMPEATIAQPGSVLIGNLKRGDKLKYLKDESPSASYDMFVNSFCSYLCSSMNMPVEVLLMKFNNNYSASRATLIMFWRLAIIERLEMVSDFLEPVYEMWLSEEIAAGRVKCPGWSDFRLRDAWLCAEWAGAPMPNIDPLKQLQGDKVALELSAKTLDDVARETNGSSGKANRIKNARQLDELPIPYWANGGGGEEIPEDDEEKDEEDDE